MNALMIAEKTMTSREIAELTGKEHKNVKRDCEAMFLELHLDALSFERIYLDAMNRKQTEYLLTFELVQTLITGYSIKLRHAVIQRLNELEVEAKSSTAVQPLIPQSLPEALRLAADLAEQKAEAEKKLAIAAPKLEVYELICESDDTLNLTEASKVLQTPRDRLKNLLFVEKWFYRRPGSGNMLGYADKVQQGLIVHKLTPYIEKATGEQRMGEQPRITGKGLVKLAKMLGVTLPPNPQKTERKAA